MFGVTRRTTFHKQYRAAAYAFPLAEFNRGGRPNTMTTATRRPTAGDTRTSG